MYLLIRTVTITCFVLCLFTFHNVSINSILMFRYPYCIQYLHSIMYLLILLCEFRDAAVIFLFTFHNVSINSKSVEGVGKSLTKFTFHNVSINSVDVCQKVLHLLDLHSIMYLLILQYLFWIREAERHLHSIMYLLIPSSGSITVGEIIHLHSIMYLLIPVLQLPLYHL